MSSYCANYYGSVNCHNVVNRFGDRCKLCLALKSGASLSDGILPEDKYRKSNSAVEAPRKHHHRSHDGSSRSIRKHGVIKYT